MLSLATAYVRLLYSQWYEKIHSITWCASLIRATAPFCIPSIAGAPICGKGRNLPAVMSNFSKVHSATPFLSQHLFNHFSSWTMSVTNPSDAVVLAHISSGMLFSSIAMLIKLKQTRAHRISLERISEKNWLPYRSRWKRMVGASSPPSQCLSCLETIDNFSISVQSTSSGCFVQLCMRPNTCGPVLVWKWVIYVCSVSGICGWLTSARCL